MRKVMTRRFCNVCSHPLEWPLIHPARVMPDSDFESRTCGVILMPLFRRIAVWIIRLVKPALGFQKYESVTLEAMKKKILKRGLEM
jgi:hypothetical protein